MRGKTAQQVEPEYLDSDNDYFRERHRRILLVERMRIVEAETILRPLEKWAVPRFGCPVLMMPPSGMKFKTRPGLGSEYLS